MKNLAWITPLIIWTLAFQGCSHSRYIYSPAPPVQSLNDRQPSPLPQKTDFDFVENAITSAVRYPIDDSLNFTRPVRSQDVNAYDQLPESTWYTPRLGYKEITPRELNAGPSEHGPPQKPIRVVKAKKSGNTPGFLIEDNRGLKYLIKFDSADYPGLDSTINHVINRIFWGFGYNVPEDHLFRFADEDLEVADNDTINQEDVENILLFAELDENNLYRTTASLYIAGKILGPIPQKGTRKGDLNDTIPHENLRILRALRVFCAFTNQSGMRSDNSVDVYVGEPGNGHTVHYLLDFGEAMGAHGLFKTRVWDGYEHFFSFLESGTKYLTLGLLRHPWESIATDKYDPRTYFDSETFDPASWKESIQFLPMRRSQPDDDYWAAKIVGALTRDHVETLFASADYPDSEYKQYMIDTLMKRREKVLDYFLYEVSPLESDGISGHTLLIEDMGKKLLPGRHQISYQVRFYDVKNRAIGDTLNLNPTDRHFEVPLEAVIEKVRNYLRVDIYVIKNGVRIDRPAEFHIRLNDLQEPQLVGVVH